VKSIIKKSQTRPATAVPAAQPGGAARPARGCDQRVRLLRADGLVHAIEVTCACGAVTVVELEYPEGTEPAR
jgi:hypothetical protein